MTTLITILGSGTCVPSLTRSACAALVETDGAKILLDLGPGTMRRLLEAGLTVSDISHILLSHFHPDHTGELVTFLFASKYPETARRSRPLTLVAGSGLTGFFEGLKAVFGDWIQLPSALFRMVTLDTAGPDHFREAGVCIESVPVVHRPESLAYRITDGIGKSVVYSGDTDVSENLVSLSSGADVLICEAAFPDELKKGGHLTPSEAGRIATRAQVGKLVLTHFYPECDAVDIIAQCRQTYQGPLLPAVDLMRIPLC